jgi:1-acyl-sn-glycerol-3-phosphate acyltransferase
MIKEYSSFLLLFIWFSYFAYILILPLYVTGNYQNFGTDVKKFIQSIIVTHLKYGFNPDIQYNELIKQSDDKIDIIIGNHMSTIDWEFVLTYLYYSGIYDYNMVGRDGLKFFPGCGFIFMIDNHIKLKRNWEEDKDTLSKQIDKINKGVIFIFPEGTRFEIGKHQDGQQFSMKNNLPVYNNLLVPKSKGLWRIFNELKQKNKLGKIFDLTIIIENLKGESAYLDDISKKGTGKVYIINREIEHPIKYSENEDFKKWLLKEWKIKDLLIDDYKKINYENMELKDNLFNLYTSFLLIIIATYGMIKRKEIRYYILTCVIIAYLIVTFKKY